MSIGQVEIMGWVYILQSSKNNSYYIGSTDDLDRRIAEHFAGKSKYTKNLLPLKLRFSQKFENLAYARSIEYKLKRLKSRKIIEQIIGDGKIKLA